MYDVNLPIILFGVWMECTRCPYDALGDVSHVHSGRVVGGKNRRAVLTQQLSKCLVTGADLLLLAHVYEPIPSRGIGMEVVEVVACSTHPESGCY